MSIRIGLFVTSLEKDFNKTPASYWIRILQMMEFYREAGARVYLNAWFTPLDAAILFRKPKRKYYHLLLWLKIISKRAYFDTCINMFSLHEEIGPERLRYARKIASSADGIICASHRIAEYAQAFARKVYVMEDPLNIRHFRFIKKNANLDFPVFGWSGVGLKSVYLNRFADQISGRILIISEPGIKKVRLDFEYNYLRWNYQSFPEDILKCDIALLPRDHEDPYNDSHSSFKALVFAAQGIPVIASKVPSYLHLAEYYDGIVFLEDYDHDLKLCIEELKKRKLNTDAVREHYSCEKQAVMLLDWIKMDLAGK